MEKHMSSSEIRSAFINFFRRHDHVFVRSSSVIPFEDPTLLFANAGMNQFKPIFLGVVEPNSDFAKLKRAVNTQKCIRAGGKHNDLDDVGKDVYHHTFFEMLGNWSFGDYFKVKEVCRWAWEFLTKEVNIPPDRLYITYFGGDEKSGLKPDEECKQIWLDIGLQENRILPFGMKDNFWEMGDIGPCGPCSEIHYDKIGNRDASALVNRDDPMVVEIWNLVFMQYNREENGVLKPLPRKHIDCGLGFERLVAVLQNKESNYDTDVFTPIFNSIEKNANVRKYTGKVGADDTDGIDMAYRVIADHIRTLCIALADGGRPDNVGRGYVLRRILRRGVRYACEKLQAPPKFFSSLVPVVVDILGDTFPELRKDPETIIDIINDEEAQFLKTLNRGRSLFHKSINMLQPNEKSFPGSIAWRLYDTYGFPVDLTQLMAEENDLTVNMEEFEECKQKAIELSSASIGKIRDVVDLDVHAIAELKNKGVPLTDDKFKYAYKAEKITGADSKYTFSPCFGSVLAIRHGGKFVEVLNSGEDGSLIMDKTNFYAEQGGQVFDTGILTKDDKQCSEFVVKNTQVRGGYVVLVGSAEGTFHLGDKLKQTIDEDRRLSIMKNHTGTHVLNFALRQVLGNVEQKGSLVAPDRLRFDFTSKQAMTVGQVKKAEEICQEVIDKSHEVFAEEAPLAKARLINGLRAVFEEAYPDPVRVVSVGVPVDQLIAKPESELGLKTPVEFCGGTHLHNVSHIGLLVITVEEAIAKGVRRIVALTGNEAQRSLNRAERLQTRLQNLTSTVESGISMISDKQKFKAINKEINDLIISLSLATNDVLKEINQAQLPYWKKEEIKLQAKDMQRKLDKANRQAKAAVAEKIISEAEELNTSLSNEEKFFVHIFGPGANGKVLDTALKGMKNVKNVMGFSVDEDTNKVTVFAKVDKSAIEQGLKASEWISKVCEVIGGKGGGKDSQAQAVGESINRIPEAVEAAKLFARLTLGP
uniref:Alanine--tRNA ligase n=1 Tax=Syphacia muris TaxID=451379 RepID=A0A0N5AUZ2_9BILA